MSTFTTTVKAIIDPLRAGEGNGEYNTAQYDALGLGSYPIFDEAHRSVLNNKIIDHFYMREIGAETVELFRLFMRRRMNEIMPRYNKLYAVELASAGIDPLETVRIANTATQETATEATGNSSNTSGSGAESRAVASDFPQQRLANDGDYATSSQDSISSSTANGTAEESSNSTQTGLVETETSGRNGAIAILMAQYRDLVWNLDADVIAELENLFMLVWTSGEEFTERSARYGFGYYGTYSIPF